MRAKLILIGAGVVGLGLGLAVLPRDAETARQSAGAWSAGSLVHYAGCNEVRALGKAPLYEGQPGYSLDMDSDGDGIACEPHH
jgi:hypothetical protein